MGGGAEALSELQRLGEQARERNPSGLSLFLGQARPLSL